MSEEAWYGLVIFALFFGLKLFNFMFGPGPRSSSQYYRRGGRYSGGSYRRGSRRGR